MIYYFNTEEGKTTLDYKQALIKVQGNLRGIERGALKEIAEQLEINYKLLIRIKNNSQTTSVPCVIATLLGYFLNREIEYEKKHYYTFSINQD